MFKKNKRAFIVVLLVACCVIVAFCLVSAARTRAELSRINAQPIVVDNVTTDKYGNMVLVLPDKPSPSKDGKATIWVE